MITNETLSIALGLKAKHTNKFEKKDVYAMIYPESKGRYDQQATDMLEQYFLNLNFDKDSFTIIPFSEDRFHALHGRVEYKKVFFIDGISEGTLNLLHEQYTQFSYFENSSAAATMTYKQIIEQYAKKVESLEEVAEMLHVTELEQEISTFIDVHSSLEELIEYIEVELEVTPAQLQSILAGNDTLHMDVYALQDGSYATIFE